MSALQIVVALGLPWIFGISLLLLARRNEAGTSAPGEAAWTLGVGYAVGAFLLTVWMRILSALHLPFSATAVGLPLLLFTIAALALVWRVAHRRGGAGLVATIRPMLSVPVAAGPLRILWWTLIAWVIVRFVMLGIEVGSIPLYPWDAWTHWATKARVWYELRSVVPFGLPEAWFAANGALYFDTAPGYPPTVPLLQVWSCLMLGRWDDTLMNWPWWALFASLVLATYGGLRRLEIGPLNALAGAFFCATLPLADTHVALAGYADLPLAVSYTMAALAFLHWTRTRARTDAALAILLALACTEIKNPGLPWALTLVPGVIVTLLPRRSGLLVVGLLFSSAALALFVVASTSMTILNYRLHLDFDVAWDSLARSYLLLGNWHLLWYAAVATALLAWRQLLAPPLLALTTVLAAGVLFLVIVFGFSTARMWVTDQTTVNRATLHFAPLIVVFVMIAYDAFAKRWSGLAANGAAASAVPTAASADAPSQ